MFEDMIPRVEQAVELSRKWAENGWKMQFGPKNAEIVSLKQAEALPVSFIYREEAVNYWHQVHLMGNDAADSGEKAAEALKIGDVDAAEKALYLSSYIERPYENYTTAWKSLYEMFKNKTAACT